MAKEQRIILYHAPPSFYSQIARLVLAEKGIEYQSCILVAGPPLYETYEPWYIKLNSGGTVPTLVIGDTIIDDSRAILYAVDAQFEGPALIPVSPQAVDEMEHWIDKAYSLPERTLTYGTGRFRALGARINAKRRHALLERRKKYPELDAAYGAKLADIDSFLVDAATEETVHALEARYESSLDEIDTWLTNRPFICGADYSLADCVWTILVARQQMLGRSPLKARPSLARWYLAVKGRDSFSNADVWEKFHARKLVPIVLKKLKWHLLGAALVLVALVGLMVRFFST